MISNDQITKAKKPPQEVLDLLVVVAGLCVRVSTEAFSREDNEVANANGPNDI